MGEWRGPAFIGSVRDLHSKNRTMTTDAGFVHPEYLVSTDWLTRHLQDQNVCVLDCTTHLPPLPDNSYYTVIPGREDFLKARIPGAALVDMDHDVADTSAAFHFMLPSAEQFAEAMSGFGIGSDTLVVSYSSANHWWASRMWWMLRVFGHDKAAVLDGGLQKWKQEGRALESGEPAKRPRKDFPRRPARLEMVATSADVLAAIHRADTCTLNALRPEQHAGTGGVTYGRRGHIPGSINVAAMHAVDANNTYRSAAELRKLFAEPMAAPRVITYCGGGIAASSAALVLAMLGHTNVALYDASLSEWARNPQLPMEV
jgi:thiosulfate/3-mercaptopyruvate sulfurtransferase